MSQRSSRNTVLSLNEFSGLDNNIPQNSKCDKKAREDKYINDFVGDWLLVR